MKSESLLDHPIISERYFFPRPDAIAEPWVVQGGAGALHGFSNAPHGGPTLLHFHGNGEVVADWSGRFTDDLVAAGLDVFLGEYRGYGGSSGEPALAGMLDDALATADATGVPPQRMVVYGRSVGSIYALHVAAHRPVAGLVIESGIADVLQRLLFRMRPYELGAELSDIEQAIADAVDHRAKMEATTCPVLVMHARGDHLVDPEHALQLARWARGRAELVFFAEGDHNSIHAYNSDEILRRVTEFSQAATAAG